MHAYVFMEYLVLVNECMCESSVHLGAAGTMWTTDGLIERENHMNAVIPVIFIRLILLRQKTEAVPQMVREFDVLRPIHTKNYNDNYISIRTNTL